MAAEEVRTAVNADRMVANAEVPTVLNAEARLTTAAAPEAWAANPQATSPVAALNTVAPIPRPDGIHSAGPAAHPALTAQKARVARPRRTVRNIVQNMVQKKPAVEPCTQRSLTASGIPSAARTPHWEAALTSAAKPNSFTPGQSQDPGQLDAHLFLRDSLPHPDLTGVVGDGTDADDMTLTDRPGEQELRIPGTISADRAVELEEAIWDRMHFASHLRTQRLGEFTVASDLHR
ncbi:MAG: hypothetical protein WBL82_03035, partial [Terriglobales bacterium]